MIALILGGAPSVWADLAAAEALLSGCDRLIVAANLAIVHYDGRIDGAATYHGDRMPAWVAERADRGLNTDFRAFTPNPTDIPTEIVSEAWDGSSGLYATRCALFEIGASGAILCGIPLIREAGHFHHPGQWAPVMSYRADWEAVSPILGDRVRSLGGWTAERFGEPDEAWIAAHA